ncbi:MAG: M48 family metalloprotease [Thermoanaerobaculia bacterium]
MTDERFSGLVRRLEGQAEKSPALYRLRVLLLALLGYGYVFLVLGATVTLVVLVLAYGHINAATLKISAVLVVFAGLIVRALWVRLEPPEGLPLAREQAAALFAELDRLRRVLQTPRIHQVLLTHDFNASVAQVPRLGIFGWQKNYLSLGLPLMQALAPDSFRAVLAHELAHLSRAHGRFGAWIYRVRLTWAQLVEQFEQRGHRGAVIFKRFFEWYAPYFGASTFVLARIHEFEADRLAARAESPRTAAMALVGVALAGDYLQRDFWPAFFRRVGSEPQPGQGFHELERTLRSGDWRESAGERLERALREETGVQDSHPCLRDRLKALGQEPALPEPPAETAAQHYLGAVLPELSGQVESAWAAQIATAWRSRHEEISRERSRVAELNAKGGLDVAEAYERAVLTESIEGADAALPLYREVLDREPAHPGAGFNLGRLLLEREDPAGLPWLEAAVEKGEFSLSAAFLLADYLDSHGEPDRARALRAKGQQELEGLQAARQERDLLKTSDPLMEHGLSAGAVADLAGQLRRYPEVSAAYLVRKEVRHFAEIPLYVLALRLPRFRTEGYHKKVQARLAQELQFPGESFLLSLAVTPRALRRRILAVPGARIL